MTSSKPRIVLLTGTSSGIGYAAALAFARAGDKVVATMRNPATAERLTADGADAAHPIECRTLDVTDAAAVATTVDAVLADHGRIDVLVNNAGEATAARWKRRRWRRFAARWSSTISASCR